MVRTRLPVAVGFVLACLLSVQPAVAGSPAPSIQHMHLASGPYSIIPGANLDLLNYKGSDIPRPTQDGYIIKMTPNLRYAKPDGTCCGAIPPVDVVHLHHGVFLSDGAAGQGYGNVFEGGFYPFMAMGEEKTVMEFPAGYGYPVMTTDHWVLNYMIHNLTAEPKKVYLTYDLDFVPATSPLAKHITPAHPIWMDVQDHHRYSVFDVLRGSGVNGQYIYPDMAKNPYAGDPNGILNEWHVDHSGTLIGTAGHVHPGGLWDELDLVRPGASVASKHGAHAAIAGLAPNSARLFRSLAHYWDPRGPISWDMSMMATPGNWRVPIKPGETLRISAAYETKRASWYESMGIMVVWMANGTPSGPDPFVHAPPQNGHVTHGRLPENRDNGGETNLGVNANKFPSCPTTNVKIQNFVYIPGDLFNGTSQCAPTITKGSSLTFTNLDAVFLPTFDIVDPPAGYLTEVFHTVTSCQNPCGLNTGISYPLANGAGGFDSGQLGYGTPAVNSLVYSTPEHLPPGTYTYFCRIHPFMRGVFRIVA